MKNIILSALMASFTLFPVGIQAQDQAPNYENVVVGGRSVDQFVEDVSTNLDRLLNRSSLTDMPVMGTGFAQVLFQSGPDGKPINISFYRKDDDVGVNRLAARAVSKIGSMYPLPSGISEDQQYLVNIIVARDYLEYLNLSEDLDRSERARLAASTDSHKILAFNLKKPVPLH